MKQLPITLAVHPLIFLDASESLRDEPLNFLQRSEAGDLFLEAPGEPNDP